MQVEKLENNGARRQGRWTLATSNLKGRMLLVFVTAGLFWGIVGCKPKRGARVRTEKFTLEELTAAVGLTPYVLTAEVRNPCHWRLVLERVQGGKTNLQYLTIPMECEKVRLVTLLTRDPQSSTIKDITCNFQAFVDGELRTGVSHRLEIDKGMYVQGSTWSTTLPNPLSLNLGGTSGVPTSIRFVIETNSVPFKSI